MFIVLCNILKYEKHISKNDKNARYEDEYQNTSRKFTFEVSVFRVYSKWN